MQVASLSKESRQGALNKSFSKEFDCPVLQAVPAYDAFHLLHATPTLFFIH
jgi:hypothetical protein